MKLIWPFNLFAKKNPTQNKKAVQAMETDSIHRDRLPWEEWEKIMEEDMDENERIEKEKNKLSVIEYNEAKKQGCIVPCDFKNTFFASRFLSMEINHFLNNNYTYPDKAKLLANCTLSLRIKKGGARNFRKVFVSNNNKESEFNIKKHLIVDDSVEGAWQAFIFQSYIDKINSIKLYFLFSKDDVKSVKTLGNEDLSLELQNYDITPYVGKYKNKYFISYCTFSQWGGLIRQNIEITLANNKITTYRVFQGINIYSYDCGFMI